MAKEWFSHDYGTRNKKKLATLLHQEKARGYGLFWIIVEMLYEDRNKYMENDELTYLAISQQSGEEIEFIKCFIDRSINVYKVFKSVRKKFFTTERVIADIKVRKEFSKQKSRAGIISGESRRKKGTPVQHLLTDVPEKGTQLNTVHNSTVHNRTIQERESPTEFHKIEDCLIIALKDQRWIKASKADQPNLEGFNRYLESLGEYRKNPGDYKKHFTNWVRKGLNPLLPSAANSNPEPKKMVM
ncbi:MAG TPA: Lin1244/Lin1753 domain-containing protein [Chitinophagaceae bacterium]|nr:Lin1244/Lin1753 domain-containing protein [Chitinophagaceae bacterium]